MKTTEVNEAISGDLDIVGNPKVERYGWVVKDEPGEFAMIDKSLLKVDHNYQRSKVANSRILRIAREWSWIACNALCVAKRTDGSLWLMDGQHRKLAADKRSDIKKLPCMVWSIEDSANEARGFLDKNTLRSSVNVHQKFKSRLYARDEVALTIASIVDESGYKIANTDSKHTVRCIAAIERAWLQDQQLAITAWETSVKVCRGGHINKDIFEGLFRLEVALQKEEKGSITDRYNIDKLENVGTDIIINTVRRIKGMLGKGGSRVAAEAILAVLNHGRSSRKIKLTSLTSHNVKIF